MNDQRACVHPLLAEISLKELNTDGTRWMKLVFHGMDSSEDCGRATHAEKMEWDGIEYSVNGTISSWASYDMPRCWIDTYYRAHTACRATALGPAAQALNPRTRLIDVRLGRLV